MAIAKPAEQTADTGDAALEAMFIPDGNKHGRHHARFAKDKTLLHPILNDLRRTGNGVVAQGDVAEAAAGWGLTADDIRAGIQYDERHREIFDAFFLLQDEEWRARNAEWRGASILRR